MVLGEEKLRLRSMSRVDEASVASESSAESRASPCLPTAPLPPPVSPTTRANGDFTKNTDSSYRHGLD